MVTLRPAHFTDAPLLSDWDKLPHVVAATGDDDGIDWAVELPRDVDWQWNFIAEVHGEPIGITQIIDPAREESHYWGDVPQNLRAIDIWIGPKEFLGKGNGTQMMTQALDFCFADPAVTGVLIDPLESNARARKFYETLGFEFVEYRTFATDDCAIYRFERPRI